MNQVRKVKFLNSIQVTLVLAIGLIVVSILSSIGVLLYQATQRVVEQSSAEATEKIIQQVNYDIEYYLKNIETTIDSLQYSDAIRNYFSDSNKINETRAVNYLSSILISREDIINIALIRPDGKVVTNDPEGEVKTNVDFTQEHFYKNAVNSDEMVVSSSHVQNLLVGQYQWVVSSSRAIKNTTTGDVAGVILVDLNFNLIHDMVSRIALGERGFVFIIDELGNMVYHPKIELFYSGIKNENIQGILVSDLEVLRDEVDNDIIDYIITSSQFLRWKVIGKVYVQDINIYSTTLKNFFITMIIVAFVIGIILSLLLAKSILHPVNKLLDGMFAFQSGQLDVEVAIDAENELGVLTDSFNQMTKRIKTLIAENKATEKTKRKSELEALQAQINPHFLYNTLDSIVWMGEAGKTEEVVKMTSSLAKLFRISINKGKEYVTIRQELEHVESYLTIQQMRYGKKLEYSIKYDDELMNVQIIKILLQPLVENAIYHGIKKCPGNGLIQIRVGQGTLDTGQKTVIIEIEDNGMGMDEQTISKILSGEISSETRGSGVGVYNVDQRIKLYYGEAYGLLISSELYEGTIVTITLPQETGGHHEEI
jgi:two-component system, sensor histidine kinase YesM